MSESNVLFVRSNEDEENDDPWDDTLLIRAYEDALDHAKRAVEAESSNHVANHRSENTSRKWKKGDACRAQFSEDGQWYEAFIKSITGGECTVEFIGYRNTDQVTLTELKLSKGMKFRKQQRKAARQATEMEVNSIVSNDENMESESGSTSRCETHKLQTDGIGAPLPPPPLPPPPILQQNGRIPDTSEALHSMLMSWYMSGYHTGYYEALKRTEQPHHN